MTLTPAQIVDGMALAVAAEETNYIIVGARFVFSKNTDLVFTGEWDECVAWIHAQGLKAALRWLIEHAGECEDFKLSPFVERELKRILTVLVDAK